LGLISDLVLSAALPILCSRLVDKQPSGNGKRIRQDCGSWDESPSMLVDLEEACLNEILRARISVELAVDVPQKPWLYEIDHAGEVSRVANTGVAVHRDISLGPVRFNHAFFAQCRPCLHGRRPFLPGSSLVCGTAFAVSDIDAWSVAGINVIDQMQCGACHGS
jgi:hypothetical protein